MPPRRWSSSLVGVIDAGCWLETSRVDAMCSDGPDLGGDHRASLDQLGYYHGTSDLHPFQLLWPESLTTGSLVSFPSPLRRR